MAQGDAAGGPRCSSLTILPVPLIAKAVAAGRRPLMLASQVGAVPAAAPFWRLLALLLLLRPPLPPLPPFMQRRLIMMANRMCAANACLAACPTLLPPHPLPNTSGLPLSVQHCIPSSPNGRTYSPPLPAPARPACPCLPRLQLALDYAADADFGGQLPVGAVVTFGHVLFPVAHVQRAPPAAGGGISIYLWLRPDEAQELREAVAAEQW